MNQQIYDQLLIKARARSYTTYSDISPLAGLDMANPDDRDEMSRLLEEIARQEQSAGRPMLTAVIIHKGDNIPGPGFFKIATEFGRFQGKDSLHFWIDAISEVHDYWQTR